MPQSFLPTHLRDGVAVSRAASDLVRRVPVLIRTAGSRALVFPMELVEPDDLERLRSGGTPDLVIGIERAMVLKAPHKGRQAVRLALPPHLDARGLRALADPTADLDRPLKGPLALVGEGETLLDKAALALMRAARLLPAAILLDNPGTTFTDGLLELKAEAIMDAADAARDRLRLTAMARLPIKGAETARIAAFRPESGGAEHFAILIGDPHPSKPPLVRLHSECFTGDTLGSLKCDCGAQWQGAVARIAAEGSGILLYLAQEGRGIGLIAKLKAYALQDQGHDTVDANLRLGFAVDERDFGPAAAMLKALGFSRIRLLTNNPAKAEGLAAAGIEVVARVGHSFPETRHNAHYLATKRDRTGHYL